MADIVKFKTLLDLYGVGVRAGVFTPQVEDEAYFRSLGDLPDMTEATKQDWNKTGGVRHPITLVPSTEGDNEV